jgi:ATP-dependent RNA helicase DeaD
MEKFKRILGSDNPLLNSVKFKGFTNPTEIQEKSIPAILKEKDVIAGASTGSGKTFAFAVGLIKNAKKNFGVQGLVLTPTRELAEQVADELSVFAKHKDLDIISVYGGVSITKQMKELTRADIVVGTPGRILDHISRNSINLKLVNTLVLDEADRMLDMGFRDDVTKIIGNCPKKRQTLLFSATISQDIVFLAQKYMECPVEISAEPQVDPKKLEQVFYDVGDHMKFSLLKHLLENEKSKLVMIFCNTRRNVEFIANNLRRMGIEAVGLHGGFSQDKRNKILEQFHSKEVHVLIATDVAARGLDIKGVSHIYNYDSPPTEKEYIHRIGRTARAGKEGKVISILASRDYENFNNIINGDLEITQMKVPFIKKVMIRWIPERNSGRGNYRGNNGRSNYGRSDNRRDSGRSYGGNDRRRDNRGSDNRRNDNRGSDNRRNYGGNNNRRNNMRAGDRRDRKNGERSDNRRSYGRDDRRSDNRGSDNRRNSGRSDNRRSGGRQNRNSRPKGQSRRR